MFTVESGADAVEAGITVQAEREGVASESVEAREKQDQRGSELEEDHANGRCHGRGEKELCPFAGEGP